MTADLLQEFGFLVENYDADLLEDEDGSPLILLDDLMDCEDVLPDGYCDMLNLPYGSSYYDGAWQLVQLTAFS